MNLPTGSTRYPRRLGFVSGLGTSVTDDIERYTGVDWELTREGGKPRTVTMSPLVIGMGIVGAVVSTKMFKGGGILKNVGQGASGFVVGVLAASLVPYLKGEGW